MPSPNPSDTSANAPFDNNSVSPEILTPMLRQYVALKNERPDVVLLMRVGDFYEAYGEDAETIAGQLNITLTGREIVGMERRFPMAGGPTTPLTGTNRSGFRRVGFHWRVGLGTEPGAGLLGNRCRR